MPFLVATCKRTAMKKAFITQDRTGGMPATVRLVEQCLRELGHHGPIVLRSDGKTSCRTFSRKWPPGDELRPLWREVHERTASAMAELGGPCGRTEEQARLIKLDFENAPESVLVPTVHCSLG